MAKDISQLVPDFKARLENFEDKITSATELQAIGDVLVDRIVERTRAGFGVDKHGGSKNRLIKLADSYKKWRKKRGLSSKSTLTLTGDMLKNIYAKVGIGKITITGRDQFTKDKIKWNATEVKYDGYTKPARIFLNLSNKDLKVIEEHFYRILRDIF